MRAHSPRLAPLVNNDLAIATAAYEHDDEAAPRPVAHATGLAPPPPSVCSMRSRGTQAWTIAEIANPSTSAHHTSQAIRRPSRSTCQMKSNTDVIVTPPQPQSPGYP